MSSDALISFEEAEAVAKKQQKSPIASSRTLLMGTTGVIAAGVLTLLVMTLVSLGGAKTGLSTILPFLDNDKPHTLQVP